MAERVFRRARKKVLQPVGNSFSWKKEFQKNWPLYLMCVPSLAFVVVFSYVPMVGLLMAFQDYKPWLGIMGSRWVALDNFTKIFQFQEAARSIVNTVIIAVFKIIGNLIVPIVVAVLLNEVRQIGVKKTIQTLIYLPYFLSWVTIAGIMMDLLGLDGTVNNVLVNTFHLGRVAFLNSPALFRPTAVLSDIWKGFGFGTIVYLGVITGISPSYYEAAEIDGASRFQQVMHVTLPEMASMIIVMATLSLGNILNAGFDQIFNLYNPLVYSTGDIIDTYVYRATLLTGQYGFGTAVGLFKSVISLVLIVVSYKIADKTAHYRIF